MTAFLIKSLLYIVGSLITERPAVGLPLAAFIGIVVIGYHKTRKFPAPPTEFPPEIPESFIASLQRSIATGELVSIPLREANSGRLVRVHYFDMQHIRTFDPLAEQGVTYRWSDIDVDGSRQ